MYYFAYGSNMDTEQMARRCVGAKLLGPARLDGYAVRFSAFSRSWNGGVADIVSVEGEMVWGVLFSVTPDDIAALDRYEGHPEHYTRISVTVLASDRSTVAWTYTVRAKKAFVPPSPRYLAAMTAAAQVHSFPGEYIAALRAVRAADV